MKISAIIISKNSEATIEDCLKSISFCDELIVVDGGSTDATLTIAKKYEAKIIKGASNDFARQRNVGLQGAKGEWIFYIDTDERVSKELERSIKKIIDDKSSEVAYKIKRKNFYFGNHEWPTIEKLERLFRRDALKGWKGQLHESAEVTGSIGELDGYLLHYTHRDLTSMLEKTNEWSEIEARLRLDSHHPQMIWWRFFRVLLTGFYDSYIRQSGWKAGTAGLVESMYQGFSLFITYAKLWEMQEKLKSKNEK